MNGNSNHTLMYHKWFGIPPEEMPTNAYRLLGIQLYEADVGVIENAVQQRISFVAQFLNSEHSEIARTIHGELKQAERCLLNPQAKATYDQQVSRAEVSRLTRISTLQATPVAPAGPIAARPMPHTPAGPAPARPRPPIPARKRASRKPVKEKSMGVEMVKIAVGGVAGVAIGLLVLVLVNGAKDDQPRTTLDDSQQAESSEIAEKPRPRAKVERLPSNSTATQPQVSSSNDGSNPTGGKTKENAVEQNPFIKQPQPVIEQNPFEVVSSNIANGASETLDNAAPAIQPTPALPADPFKQLPDAVSLPSLLIREPRELLALGKVPSAAVTLELVTSAADLPENRDFELSPDPKSPASKWDLLLVDQGEQQIPSLPVATMSLVGKSLTFYWFEEAVGTAASQLRNCLLRLTIGKKTHAVCLREPETSGPVILDLDERVIKRSVVIDQMPPADQLRFEVTGLENFPDQTVFKNDRQSADISSEIVLELRQTGGAYFRIKTTRAGDGELSLLVLPMYKINAADQFDLTTDRLDSMKTGTATSLLSANQDLAANLSELKALELHYNGVSGTSASNPGQALVKKQQLDAIASRAKVLNRRIKSLQQRIPEMQARLAAIPQLEQLVAQLHNKAQLSLRIFVSVDGQDLTLYTAG